MPVQTGTKYFLFESVSIATSIAIENQVITWIITLDKTLNQDLFLIPLKYSAKNFDDETFFQHMRTTNEIMNIIKLEHKKSADTTAETHYKDPSSSEKYLN